MSGYCKEQAACLSAGRVVILINIIIVFYSLTSCVELSLCQGGKVLIDKNVPEQTSDRFSNPRPDKNSPRVVSTRVGPQQQDPSSKVSRPKSGKAVEVVINDDPSIGQASAKNEIKSLTDDEVNKILRKIDASLLEIFNSINTTLDPNRHTERSQFMDQEQAWGFRDDNRACPVKTSSWPAMSLLQHLGDIAQAPNTTLFAQYIPRVVCENPDSPCEQFDHVSTKTVCRQKKSVQRLLFINKLDRKHYIEEVEVESCCVCHIMPQRVDDFSERRSQPVRLNNSSSNNKNNESSSVRAPKQPLEPTIGSIPTIISLNDTNIVQNP